MGWVIAEAFLCGASFNMGNLTGQRYISSLGLRTIKPKKESEQGMLFSLTIRAIVSIVGTVQETGRTSERKLTEASDNRLALRIGLKENARVLFAARQAMTPCLSSRTYSSAALNSKEKKSTNANAC